MAKRIAKITKITVLVEGREANGKRFRQRFAFERIVEANYSVAFGRGTGYEVGFGRPADVQYTGERRFTLRLSAIDPVARRKYNRWKAGMHHVEESIG